MMTKRLTDIQPSTDPNLYSSWMSKARGRAYQTAENFYSTFIDPYPEILKTESDPRSIMFSALGMLWINTLDYFGEESTRAYAIATVMFG